MDILNLFKRNTASVLNLNKNFDYGKVPVIASMKKGVTVAWRCPHSREIRLFLVDVGPTFGYWKYADRLKEEGVELVTHAAYAGATNRHEFDVGCGICKLVAQIDLGERKSAIFSFHYR